MQVSKFEELRESRAPQFESGARWSARRVLMHVIAETARHTGPADIIREPLDGAGTLGQPVAGRSRRRSSARLEGGRPSRP